MFSRSANIVRALLIALPCAALAQGNSLQLRASGYAAGIPVPVAGAASAEEATALEVNPAGTGFVDGFTLHYFHEGGDLPAAAGDGFWLATPFGPLVSTFAMQWIRPGDGGGPRFRKTSFGLAAGDGQAVSVGVSGNWFSSPDAALDRLWTFDAGIAVRPSRHLSIGASVLGLNSAGAAPYPVQLDVGVATRLWRDRLTLSADVLGNDRARNDFAITAGAVGLGAEVAAGFVLMAQLQFPLQSASGPAGSTYGQLLLGWNAPHAGVAYGRGSGTSSGDPWLVGARVSSRRYLSISVESAPHLDLAKSLSHPRISLFSPERDAYTALLQRIARFRDDGSVAALVVTIDDLPVGQGRAEELRRLLLQVKERKPVIAYLTGGGMKEYYLATAATRIVMPPSAYVSPSGLASSTFFVKDTLQKLGITVDVVAIGQYKNAADPLVRSDMSEAQREVTESILDDLYARQVRGIADARRLPEERVRALVDTSMFTAEEATAARLVDGSAWPDELGGIASTAVGHRVDVKPAEDPAPLRRAQRWGRRPAIAVIRVEGVIASGESRSTPFGSLGIAGAETVAKLIQQAVRDRDVVAIVLRVESPGGDAAASDLIWREVMQARRAGKPVVASLGDLAASGGYFVAAAADRIVAEPSTLTGSIGVFAAKPDFSGLLEKIGVHAVTLKRGRHADLQALTRRWTADERALVEKEVRAFYDLFLGRVAAGRTMKVEDVDRVARGRVWTGAQALERGLVDELGSFEDAVRIARERAGRSEDDDVVVRPFEPPRNLLERIVSTFTAAGDPDPPLLARAPGLGAAAALLELGPILALPPQWIGNSDTP